ncbi:c-type cytochrome domain-containing protein [Tropicimonas marinistellae]|uniref:c-type cytochrome domain-containing protein n=1 Tax=Tropicimonas marinistellae TaxID=1739787 RepID=UPI000831CE67|nr:c-type cytochrome domain-containing protein [Tropicimonas marinistellae]
MRPRWLNRALALLVFLPCVATAGSAASPGWTEVSAIFTERCVMCHSAVSGASKGLRLDNYAAALIGSERGVVLIPGDPSGSELIRRLRGESVPRMPFLSRPLADDQIELIESWIAAGLPKASQAQ